MTAYCLEPHDLWISKAIAHRPKDIEFCDALLKRGIVDPATLESRLGTMKGLDEAIERSVRDRIDRARG